MAYQVVQDYYREEHFRFFRRYPSPFWAVTFELEITRLRELTRRRKYRIYPHLCHRLLRAAQPIDDFRYRLREGEIVLHDVLHPGLTVSAPDARFTFAHLNYAADSESFNRQAESVLAQAESGVSLAERHGRAWVFFSALPKIAFTGLTHAVRGVDDTEIRVSFGKFREDGERLWVPVGLQVNHLFIDGGMVGELVERTQAEYADAG
jgi:chloramphenicol O-acetyltransferase type A